MELRQIRYVLAVADERHFRRAAQHIHVTQPSLSRQVKALEEEIGIEVFRRTSHGVELTPAGAEFVSQSRRALRSVDGAVQRAQEVSRGARGHVSLGFVATAAIDILPFALARHRDQHPGVVVTLAELTTEQQVLALESGELDVGLGRDVRPVPGLQIQTLRREPVVVALPATHPLATSSSLRLCDLADGAIVKLPRDRARRIDDLIRRIGQSRVGAMHGSDPVVQQANQYMTLLALVAADIGAALVPESIRTLRSQGVVYRPLEDPEAYTSLTVATRSEPATPAAHHLCSILAQEFGVHGR